MEIKVSNNLKRIAEVFANQGHLLYIVGGYVRNCILNINSADIDIASSMPVEQVEEVLHAEGVSTQIINKDLGTLLITHKNGEQYEYTTFRSESYGASGEHSPEAVEFLTDAKQDASRRDFTVNAIYYDIVNKKVVDYFNGIEDVKKRIIKTVNDPNIVFSFDGLRILRLVRFLCELDFVPERKTKSTAKKLAHKVKDISKERILKEIKISVEAGLRHGITNNTHKYLVKYYNQLQLWQYVFNSSFARFKAKQSGRFYGTFVKSGGECRYIALMCLILNSYLKTKTTEANLVLTVNNLLGASGLKDSNKSMQEVLDAYRFAQFLQYENIYDLLNNKRCIAYEKLSFEIKKYLSLLFPDKVTKIRLNIMEMKKRKVPFDKDDLKISNADLIEKLRIPEKNISKIKFVLYEMCVDNKIINDRQILIEQAKFLNEQIMKNKNINAE